MKRIIKYILYIFVAICILYVFAAVVVWRNVATGYDRDITNVIRREFKQTIETKFQKEIECTVTPLRKKTIIYINNSLSDNEKKTLQSIVNRISNNNSNRVIEIKYKY
jgi:uncharacterized membrane protein SpoIIM required for sporulation